MLKIGPRLWKTGLAVALTVVLVRLTGHPYEVYGALAAALAVAPTASHSLKTMMHQIGANLLGALAGALAVLLFGPQPHVMGGAVVLVLFICQKIGWKQISGSVVTVTLFVMAPHSDALHTYVLWRLASVLIGLLVGTGVNALIAPPNYYPSMIRAIKQAGAELDDFIQTVAAHLEQPSDLTKPQVLADAAHVDARLAEARQLLPLLDGQDPRRAVLERSLKVLASLLERIQIIHKCALAAQRSPQYHEQLPEVRAALAEIIAGRQALYRQLEGERLPAETALRVAEVEQRFELPKVLPALPEDQEAFFRLYRIRSSVSYMANRLGRLFVAMDAALLPQGAAERTGALQPT